MIRNSQEKINTPLEAAGISTSMTVQYASSICYSALSPPSGAHGRGWEALGKDGEEPAATLLISY